MKIRNVTFFCLLFIVSISSLFAQKTHSDNGDGTFTNPVIAADFPDIDLIRVDDTYYMITTTMFIFPGVTLLKSKDLVNWEYCKNVVSRMDISPCYNLDGCNRYAHGQWATSLKYHDGLFYLFFNTLNDGGYVCTAKDPEGSWDIRKLKRGFHDPGLFFDTDGKIYVAFGYGRIFVTELDKNLAPISKDSLVFVGRLRGGLEGSHIYKLNGYYYLYCTYGGADGFQVALRSRNIYGPYEEKVVIKDNTVKGVNFGIHQGALVQTQTGEWWTMLFVDVGPFGRFPSLQPVKWEEGWPIAGVEGRGVVTYKKPNVGKNYPIKDFPTSDEFETSTLGMQWGWNHNPDSTKWSLQERRGFLRLKTSKVVTNLRDARNTLTQRLFSQIYDTIPSQGIIKMYIDKMKDGDVAGLAVFQDPYACIAVKKVNDKSYVIMMNNGRTVDSTLINCSIVYLAAKAEFKTSRVSFTYSVDNKSFKHLGNELRMRFNLSVFTGNKFCLFNYATKELGGIVDFDWFKYL